MGKGAFSLSSLASTFSSSSLTGAFGLFNLASTSSLSSLAL